MTAAAPADWSEWRPLPLRPVPSAAVLAETLDGGQAFRWRHHDEVWEGIFGNHLVRLQLANGGSQLRWSPPAPLAEATAPALVRYLDADRDAILSFIGG